MADFKLILFFYSIQYLSVNNVQSGGDKSTTRQTTATSSSTTPTTPTTSMTPTTRTTSTSQSPSTASTHLTTATTSTTSTQKTVATCDLDWIKINDLCYQIVKQLVSDSDAKHFCPSNSNVATGIPPTLKDKFDYDKFLWVNISGNVKGQLPKCNSGSAPDDANFKNFNIAATVKQANNTLDPKVSSQQVNACKISDESKCTDKNMHYILCSKAVTYEFLPTVTESPCYCPCSVPRVNLTAKEFKESLREITIDVKNTSKYIRSKISVPDERTSSKAIGMVAIVFIVIPFGLLIIMDIPTLAYQIVTTFKQIRQRIK